MYIEAKSILTGDTTKWDTITMIHNESKISLLNIRNALNLGTPIKIGDVEYTIRKVSMAKKPKTVNFQSKFKMFEKLTNEKTRIEEQLKICQDRLTTIDEQILTLNNEIKDEKINRKKQILAELAKYADVEIDVA
jgi:hypothetical protein